MRNILVTGATRGLGLAITGRLLKEPDTHLVCLGRTPSPEFEALVAANEARVFFRRHDLSDLDGIPALVRGITREVGPLYGLVNNAALGADGVLATQHASEIARAIRVNLEAPILMSKYACRSMLTQGTGRIINISSIIARTGYNGLAVYGATKAGIEGFTRSLSRELGRAGITVNCVAPGYMETDMTAGLQGEKLNSIRRRAPLGLPRPADVVGAVAYLMSDEAAMVTGSVVTVDGGSTA
ncbi:3-oxoacyl-[acyl-carrier protein] reductase [Rhodovulum imhoffii]|uniref:3-oxoacyl-[acyl-carrier protein] reductase n=1 Tax=Rhodovulum imhoffii TaxID=365340 RepID=A0A2T5BU53_9RHOB|nr:SDR family oxidoreductase [Rhodovulum imhoffii]MBK5932735.1 3-oxoacyl-ACP reductase [Rhodovulum imhoffii]PTN02941.1 3-oxoacyl-[acyl-carrier protein] reductase [Rhodovulum imhoffii]